MKAVSVRDLYDYINTLAPYDTQEAYDNAGLNVGDFDTPVPAALLALDVTPAVLDEAKQLGIKTIICHHPVIFSPLRRLGSDDLVYKLVSDGMNVLSAHTNLDRAPGGVSDTLFSCLTGLQGSPVFNAERKTFVYAGALEKEMSLDDFLKHIKQSLPAEALLYEDGGKPVRRVAVCGGAGSDELETAAAWGADTFVTGEIKHHVFLRAKELGISAVAAGHFETENPVMRVLCKRLLQAFPSVRFVLSAQNGVMKTY